MAVSTTLEIAYWRPQAVMPRGGPHGQWVGDVASVGDASGGTHTLTFTCRPEYLLRVDWWWVSTNDATGVDIARADVRPITAMARFSAGVTAVGQTQFQLFGEAVRHIIEPIQASRNFLRALRANVDTETFEFHAGGRFWDQSLLRLRGEEIDLRD